MPKVYGYYRHSITDVDPDTQITELSEQLVVWFNDSSLAEKGYELSGVVVDLDNAAGTACLDRPEMKRLWQQLERGDVLLITRTDRAFLSDRDFIASLETLDSAGVIFVLQDFGVCSANPDWQTQKPLLSQMVELQRQRKSEAQQRSHVRRRELGRVPNQNVPYGYKLVGSKRHRRKAPDPDERQVMSLVVELRESGCTFTEIYRELSRRKIVNKRTRRRWADHSLRNVYKAELELRALPPDTTKICCRCHDNLPNTAEFFGRNRSEGTGLRPECRNCQVEYRRGDQKRAKRKQAEATVEQLALATQHMDQQDRVAVKAIVEKLGGATRVAKQIKQLYDELPAGGQRKANLLFQMLKMIGV